MTVRDLRKIFVIDGVGALVSALLLGVVLPSFPAEFGVFFVFLPYLSGIALVLAMYSLTCASFNLSRPIFLRGIVFANLAYCLLTISLVIYAYPALSPFGLTYFIAEILIILFLIRIEWISLRYSHRLS